MVKHCAMANHFNGDLGKSLTFLLAETVPLFNLLTITIRYRFIDAHDGFYSALYLCNKEGGCTLRVHKDGARRAFVQSLWLAHDRYKIH